MLAVIQTLSCRATLIRTHTYTHTHTTHTHTTHTHTTYTHAQTHAHTHIHTHTHTYMYLEIYHHRVYEHFISRVCGVYVGYTARENIFVYLLPYDNSM